MSTAAGTGDAQEARIAGLLAGRRNYQEDVKRLVAERSLVVFYGCGAILDSIVETWTEYVGRTIDFCCDSDPAKWGQTFAGGIPCISPEELQGIKDRCTVFVTIGEFQPVFEMLVDVGFPSVNLIYKYDLVTSAFLAGQDDAHTAASLARARALLADERSREVFDTILERILGDGSDAGLMPSICEGDQYFPADVVHLTDDECFVDIGAYDGDTVRDLIARTGGRFEHITCFEVDSVNFAALDAYVRQTPQAGRITTHNLGIWDRECDITYSIGQSQSTIGEGETVGHVVPLDDILGDERVTYIKMDIEGAEPEALKGAGRVIRAQQPRLAVCVYHHVRHLWDIPLAMHELVPDYRIYLRHHTNLEYETVCYAVPPSGGAAVMKEKELEQSKRAKLRQEKPLVYDKVIKIDERYRAGIATPIIDIAYSYACNLSCDHCTASGFKRRGARKLTPADLRRVSDEADALGLCQFCISGGEPLIFTDLDQVVAALQPDKFHLAMSTNGHFMTAEMARHLKAIGIDKVKISLDDFDEAMHDLNRKDEGAYRKAIDAMMRAKEAGLSVVVQTVVTHQNCRTPRLEQMARFAEENGFTVDVLVARATGAWEGRHDVLIDEEDAAFIRRAHDEHPVLHRDTFPSYGMDKGCGCVDSTLHITQYGDVLPCVYVHIAIGNVFEESLADILARGQSIRCFSEHSSLCLSGEDRDFIDRYMTRFYGKQLPIPWTEAFADDDFVKETDG